MSKVYRRSRPEDVLKPGTYRLLAQQQIRLGSDPAHDAEQRDRSRIYEQEIEIDVRLERFQPVDAVLRYPLPGIEGSFPKVLPHIVLRNASLPWERAAGSTIPKKGTPSWMALLVFAGADRPTIQQGKVEELFQDKTAVAEASGPMKLACYQGKPAAWEAGRSCRYIDLSWKLFTSRVPRFDQLSQLVHQQQAGHDGELQAVVLSRDTVSGVLAPSTPKGPVDIEIHLVSLEGMEHVLSPAGKRSPAKTAEKVRLLSLDSWNFKHYHGGVSSSDLGRWLSAVSPAPMGSGQVSPLADAGFVLFEEAGAQLAYRGPLLPLGETVPALETPARKKERWSSPSKGYRILKDGGTTITDISAAAAWEMGRLVALSDPALGKELARLRELRRYVKAAEEKGFVEKVLHGKADEKTGQQLEVKRLLESLGKRLVQMSLLDEVPLHYLLPDPAMLPESSASAVLLDQRWVDAWLGGVFSSGRYLSTDMEFEDRLLADLLRPSSFRKGLPQRITGLLLRSEVVARWPSIDVCLTAGGSTVTILRKAQLAPDVMLILADGLFREATFSLPPESSHFQARDPLQTAMAAEDDSLSHTIALACVVTTPSFRFAIPAVMETSQ